MRGCLSLASIAASRRSSSVTTSLRRGLCSFSATLFSNKNTAASCVSTTTFVIVIPTGRHSIPSSNARRRLVTPPSESRWIAVLVCKVLVPHAKWTYWPCDLDLWPLNPKTVSLLGYPNVILCTKFEHFGIIHFRVMLLTNRQTNRLENPTHTDRHIRSNQNVLIEFEPTPYCSCQSLSPPSECEWSAIIVWNEVSLSTVIDLVIVNFDLLIPKPCHF